MKPVAVKVMVSSSPGRGEKLPDPGLGRLFRRKSGRRSARPRSSPMIVSRSRSVARRSATEPALPEGGDPTSPKVTCMGQVRISKKKKKKNCHNNDIMPTTPLPSPHPPKLCRCFDRGPACTLSCHPSSLWRWRCWGRNEKKKEANDDPVALAAPVNIAFVREIRSVEEEEEENGDSEEEEETTGFVSAAAPVEAPPKNVLLLMRCRSAPHNRSSALALSRFAPTENGGNGDEVKDTAAAAASSNEYKERNAAAASSNEYKERNAAAAASNRKSTGDVTISSSSSASVVAGQVTTLTRCKSAPAEKAERMMPVGPDVLSYCGKNGSGGSGKERLGMVHEEGPRL